jgi:hypothetical protein
VTGPPPGTASLLLRVRSASFDHPPQVSLMSLPSPTPPSRLGTYAREVLELLAGHKAAVEIVIGGGIALAHYVDYRDTFDLDAWWAVAPTKPTNALLEEAMQTVAKRHGMDCVRRSWGETVSLEIVDGNRKVFSLQIAPRDRYLDATLEAGWPPIRIETLRDNVASKMNALVNRGAPRDLRDIYEVCRRGLLSASECWQLYEAKNPGLSADDATAKVLHALERLEIQRPLASIQDVGQRHEAAAVRNWYRDVFCRQPT